VLGGAGDITKYLALALFDPHGAERGGEGVVLVAVTRVGLWLGAFLIPLGLTGLPAWMLLRRHGLVRVVLTTIAVVVVIALVQSLAERGLATLEGDPLRLQSEGVLALMGTAAVAGGVWLLKTAELRQPAARAAAASGARSGSGPLVSTRRAGGPPRRTASARQLREQAVGDHAGDGEDGR
jgi:hypothetical protein